MKFAFATIALSIAAALTACQTVVPDSTLSTVEKATVKSDTELKTLLSAYTWSYQPANSKVPIILNFADQRLSINTGCNTAFGEVNVKNAKLEVGRLASTMKMCSPELMVQENLAVNIFGEKNLIIAINQVNPKQPVLSVQTITGQKYQFIGSPTAETKYQGQAEIIFMEVAPELVDCVGIAPQKCMRVREIQYNSSGVKTNIGEWQLFYNSIEGFQHDPNIRTVLRLKRFTLTTPAADQSKYVYVHDLTVEQARVN